MLVTIADDMNHHHALYGHIIKRIFGHHTSIVIDVYSFIAVVSFPLQLRSAKLSLAFGSFRYSSIVPFLT
jgi:hypothetical protein